MLSLNVRGLRNGNKRRAIFSCLKKVKKLQSFVCKKPTHHPKMIKLWSAECGASIIYLRGTTHSKGVCILLNPSSPFNLSSIKVDPEGSFLIAKLTIEENTFSSQTFTAQITVVSLCTGTQRNEILTNCVTTPCMDMKTIGIPPCTGTPGQPQITVTTKTTL